MVDDFAGFIRDVPKYCVLSIPRQFGWARPNFVAGAPAEKLYHGEWLAKKGVVFVSIAYRLGVFGFLAHPELSAESPRHESGNYSLLDMIAGLQWVQRNVAAFGGDPKRVTIQGESAGAAAVSILCASPASPADVPRCRLEESVFWLWPSITHGKSGSPSVQCRKKRTTHASCTWAHTENTNTGSRCEDPPVLRYGILICLQSAKPHREESQRIERAAWLGSPDLDRLVA